MIDDDVRPADVEAAIQVAWMVDPPFAAELAKLHSLYDKICLCCAWEPIAPVTPTKALVDTYGKLAYQLCLNCHYSESRKLLVRGLTNALGNFSNPCAEISLGVSGTCWGPSTPKL